MGKMMVMLITSAIFIFTSCIKQEGETGNLNSQVNNADLQKISVNENTENTTSIFEAILNGYDEIPLRETIASGQVSFELSQDSKELYYKLYVSNIKNVTMVLIHIAPPGSNGPVVVRLYSNNKNMQLVSAKTNGIVLQGVIRKNDLVGLLANREVYDLVDLILSSNAYVNVHTEQFPGGEIRGQIIVAKNKIQQ